MEFGGKLFAIRSLPTRSIKMALDGANDADIFKESFVLRADGAVEARVAPTESVAGSPLWRPCSFLAHEENGVIGIRVQKSTGACASR